MKWTYINSKNVSGFTYVPVTFPFNKPDSILVENLKIEQYIEYINKFNVCKAYIQWMANFEFIKKCPNLEHIAIEFKLPFSEYKNATCKGNKIYKEYNIEPILSLHDLKSLTLINNEEYDIKTKAKLDISALKKLLLFNGEYSYTINIDKAFSLKTLLLTKYSDINLIKLSNLTELDTFETSFSKIQTLIGIEKLNKMQCVYLNYNRSLKDISALRDVKSTLKALRIENCPKIEDFSVLGELENLELLELTGSNVLPSLDFIRKMKNLKTFVFNMNVLDGDLTPCLNLSYVYSEKNRKHYNLKDNDLPKGKYVRGNEDIEEWRRLE